VHRLVENHDRADRNNQDHQDACHVLIVPVKVADLRPPEVSRMRMNVVVVVSMLVVAVMPIVIMILV
jgi:hypothetical protein